MKIIELYPYEWVQINGYRLKFGCSWKETQSLLGKPEHRYMSFDFNDYKKILKSSGKYRKDYCNHKPIKGEFLEERKNLYFFYENYNLKAIEVLGKGVVQLSDEYLTKHSYLIQRTEFDKTDDEIFDKMKICILREYGMIIKMYRHTEYIVCSKSEFISRTQ